MDCARAAVRARQPEAGKRQARRRDAERAKHAAAAQGAVRRQRGHRSDGLRRGGELLEQSQEKPVRRPGRTGGRRRLVIVGQGQQLPGRRRARGKDGVTRSLQKSVDLRRSLASEHRARDVEHAAAGREQRPQRVEQPRLRRRERRQVRRRGAASARRDGGGRCRRRCTARRAGSRRTAGRPTSASGSAASTARVSAPRPRRASVSSTRARRSRSRSIASSSRSASSSKCAVLPPGAAQASRTRAPGPAQPGHEQRRRALRVGVLDRHPPLGEPGQAGDGHGLDQGDRRAAERDGADAARGERIEVRGDGRSTRVDAQGHRRMDVVGVGDRRPALGPVGAQAARATTPGG